jgi:NitT/TauT family transport system substrate-binding protein
MHLRILYKLSGFIGLLCLLATSCTTVPQATAGSPTQQTQGTSGEQVTLKMAVLPILDALPMYVADQRGYFEGHNLKVEFIPVGSAAERDQLMAAGQADGMINDLVSTLFYNKDAIQIQVIGFARTATPDFPQYRILAAKDSSIRTANDLKGVEIGISEGSVIAYTTDRLLEAEGLKPADIKTLAVPKISDRLALLASGQLLAANLPDPLSSLAIQQGARVILDDTKHPELGNSLISFRKPVLDDHPEAVRAFMASLEQAIQDINANPDQWNDLLTGKQLVPASLIGSYKIPTFPTKSVPSEAQWNDVLAWAKEKGLIAVDVAYQESVTTNFLP